MYIARSVFPYQLRLAVDYKQHVRCRKVRLETSVFIKQDNHKPADITEEVISGLQQYLAGEYHQRDTSEVAIGCPIPGVEHLDSGIFPHSYRTSPIPNANRNGDQSMS